jgi:hypothetical protein
VFRERGRGVFGPITPVSAIRKYIVDLILVKDARNSTLLVTHFVVKELTSCLNRPFSLFGRVKLASEGAALSPIGVISKSTE